MMRSWIALVLVASWGCGSGGEPPPTTTTTTTKPPPGGCSLPDVGRGERRCYVTMARAGTRDGDSFHDATGLLREMMIEDQELVNTSRNFMGAGETCPHLGEHIPPFHVKRFALLAFAHTGFVLHDGGREVGVRSTIGHPSMLSFVGEGAGLGRLQRVNRLCDDFGESLRPWCGRTGVFKPTLQRFRTDARAQLDLMRLIDGRADHLGFDGIRAWCEAQ